MGGTRTHCSGGGGEQSLGWTAYKEHVGNIPYRSLHHYMMPRWTRSILAAVAELASYWLEGNSLLVVIFFSIIPI